MSEHKIPSDVVQARCRALIAHIKKFPQTFDMDGWMYSTKIDKEHPCGTAGCLAGTLVFLEDGPLSGKVAHDEWDPFQDNIPKRAQKLLEIDDRTALTLWYENDWPDQFSYMTTGHWAGPEDGIKRIEHFMRTGE